MSLPEYVRYGRQMILPGMSLEGQLKLRRAKVLVVGGGGLGCPATQYLAAAGVGSITVIDGDVVETSNLARQILHTDARVGMSKAESIKEAVKSINPHITVNALFETLTSSNAQRLIASHDVTLDCTDNALTRYLISDAAVLSSKQVVSGAAQGYEGQLLVLHKLLPAVAGEGSREQERGPCYRCLFPKAPRPQDVTDCEEGGVLGTVTGIVGTLQALETIKLIAGLGEDGPPSLLLVSSLSVPPFRSVKLRPRRLASCRACGDASQVGVENMIRDLETEDYVAFCGLGGEGPRDGNAGGERIGAERLRSEERSRTTILDVRPEAEFGIASLPGSLNVPFTTLRRDPKLVLSQLAEVLASPSSSSPTPSPPQPREITVVCRRGNDSLVAARLLNEAQAETSSGGGRFVFRDVRGGLRAFADVEPQFPTY